MSIPQRLRVTLPSLSWGGWLCSGARWGMAEAATRGGLGRRSGGVGPAADVLPALVVKRFTLCTLAISSAKRDEIRLTPLAVVNELGGWLAKR